MPYPLAWQALKMDRLHKSKPTNSTKNDVFPAHRIILGKENVMLHKEKQLLRKQIVAFQKLLLLVQQFEETAFKGISGLLGRGDFLFQCRLLLA